MSRMRISQEGGESGTDPAINLDPAVRWGFFVPEIRHRDSGIAESRRVAQQAVRCGWAGAR